MDDRLGRLQRVDQLVQLRFQQVRQDAATTHQLGAEHQSGDQAILQRRQVGHRFGPASVPDEVGASLFALGAERSRGTYDLVAALKRAEPQLIVRPADAEIVPPLSDYEPFWKQRIPFLFLSAGRSAVYHTPYDTPDRLDHPKIAATARWLTRFVRAARTRPATQFMDATLDQATLAEVGEVIAALAALSPEAAAAQHYVQALRNACDRSGALPKGRRPELAALVSMLEARLQ